MAWSTITGEVASTATVFGGDVMNKINNMFNGVDISDSVTIIAAVPWTINDLTANINIVNTLDVNANFIQFDEITLPANPATNSGKLYIRDVATVETLFFLDSAGTETNLLAGGSQTPWASDIVAAGFDLNDLSNLEFRVTTGAPAFTIAAIWADAGGININVPSADIFDVLINGGSKLSVSATVITVPQTLQFPTSNQRIDTDTGGINIDVDTGDTIDLRILTTNEYVFNATEVDFLGNNLRNFGFIESNATNPAAAGAIRLGNTELIAWRNFTNGNDISIEVDINNSLTIRINGTEEYNISPTAMNLRGNGIQNCSQIDTNGTQATVGYLRIAINDILAWRNNAATDNLGIRFNTSDRFAFLGTAEVFDSNIFTNHPALASADPAADTLLIRDATDGLIKEVFPDDLELVDWGGNDLINVGFIESNAAIPATTGTIRLGTGEDILFRNSANDGNISIREVANGLHLDVPGSSRIHRWLTNGATRMEVRDTGIVLGNNSSINFATGNLLNVSTVNLDESTLTEVTDVITVTKSYHLIAGEAAADDDLVTINGGTSGDILYIKPSSDTVSITVKSTGNIVTSGSDFIMDNANDIMHLLFDGTNWLEVSRSNNGA